VDNLFFSFLNRSLLISCALLLASSIIVGAIAGVLFLTAMNPPVSNGYVSVPYAPLTPLTLNEIAPGIPRDPGDQLQLPPEDIKLGDLASQSCQALSQVAKGISNNRTDLHGVGLAICKSGLISAAKEFGSKAANYLVESAAYFSQLANDSHLAARYPDSSSDEQTRQILDDMAQDFKSKFQVRLAEQEAGDQSALGNASTERTVAATAISVAGAAFVGFIGLAMLIVFLRIEKHLQKIGEPSSPMSGQSNVARLPVINSVPRSNSEEWQYERTSTSSSG